MMQQVQTEIPVATTVNPDNPVGRSQTRVEQVLRDQRGTGGCAPYNGRPTKVAYVEFPPDRFDKRGYPHTWFPLYLQHIILLDPWKTYIVELTDADQEYNQRATCCCVPVFLICIGVAAGLSLYLNDGSLDTKLIPGLGMGVLAAVFIAAGLNVPLNLKFRKQEKAAADKLVAACPNLISLDVEVIKDPDEESTTGSSNRKKFDVWVIRYYSDVVDEGALVPVTNVMVPTTGAEMQDMEKR